MDDALKYIMAKIIEDVSKEGMKSILGQIDNCVSVSVFAAKLLTLFGFSASPIEACAIIVPNTSKRIGHGIGNPSPGDNEWHGHMVVHLSQENKIIDFSLCYQEEPAKGILREMFIAANADPNEIYYFPANIPTVVEINGKPRTQVGTGLIEWSIFPDAESWRDIGWDISMLEKYAENTFHQQHANNT